MREIGYRTWGLIPVDPDPATGELLAQRPPMMVVTAVDRNASLLFELKTPPDQLQVSVEVTALTAENQPHPSVRVFSGPVATDLQELETEPWQRLPADELYVVYTASVQGVRTFLKLAFGGPTLVVNKVWFQAT